MRNVDIRAVPFPVRMPPLSTGMSSVNRTAATLKTKSEWIVSGFLVTANHSVTLIHH